MDPVQCVFVVDDDAFVLRAIERLIRSTGLSVETFTSAASFLERLPYEGPACLVLDMSMPGLSGLDVQSAMAVLAADMPIVFLSGASDVPDAAKAMRNGAVDFLTKPVNDVELLDAVVYALAVSAEIQQRRRLESEGRQRLARLTKRERQVCDFVAAGFLNKQIAYDLGTSEKTIKVHRARVMHKLEVDSVAGLVWLLSRMRKPPFT